MENRKKYWLNDSMTDDLYSDILDICEQNCTIFSVVINKRALPARSVFDFVDRMGPYIIEDTQKSAWPGGGVSEPSARARVIYALLCAETVKLLKQAASGLYDWAHPFLPEDLAFYRPDETVFFAVIGHEGVAFFEIYSNEKDQLTARIPELALLHESPI